MINETFVFILAYLSCVYFLWCCSSFAMITNILCEQMRSQVLVRLAMVMTVQLFSSLDLFSLVSSIFGKTFVKFIFCHF